MRVMVIAEYLHRLHWYQSALVGVVARGLALGGHEVLLVCDGAAEPRDLAGVAVRIRRPLRTRLGRQPLGFASWVRRVRGETVHDVSLSLTRLAPGDVWAPIGPTTGEDLVTLVRSRAAPSVLMEVSHQPWVPAAAFAERRAAAGRGWKRRARIGPAGAGCIGLGYIGTAPEMSETEAAEFGSRVRRSLGIGDGELAVLVSDAHLESPGLEPFLDGLARVRPWPVLLSVGRRGYSMLAAARRAGCGHVCFLGATRNMAAAIAGADIVAAPFAARHGTGRLIADALRIGRPVLADAQASGADLLERAQPPGQIVRERTYTSWREALELGASERWRSVAAQAAREAARAVSPDAFFGRLTRLLGDVARPGARGGRGYDPG